VSWAAQSPVRRPRLRLGRPGPGFGTEIPAEERVYAEALTGETVYTYHVRLDHLPDDTFFVYEVLHDGAAPVAGMFRTGPRGRSKGFRFTSFGDQSVPAPVGPGLGPATANAGYIVDAVDALDPLFHLMNGDLCYANISDAPVGTWTTYGFASFDVVPVEYGGTMSITVTHYGAAAGSATYSPLDQFVLRKPLRQRRAEADGAEQLAPARH
jgi:hypothetical protein